MENSATMKGVGTMSALNVQNGGTLLPGSYTSSRRYGTISTIGSLNIYEGAEVVLTAYSNKNNNTSRSFLNVGGDLKLYGNLTIELGYTPAAGDELVFWTAKNVVGTPATIKLPELPAGLEWDTTDLLTPTGTLRVVADPTGIKNISTDNYNIGIIYSLDGKVVENPIKKGIYIKNGKKIVFK